MFEHDFDDCKPKRKKPFRKEIEVTQTNKNFAKQFAQAAADGGDAVIANILALLDNVTQTASGGNAEANATNKNDTDQMNFAEAEIEEEDKGHW